ncbi:hypothetical protein C8J56DRAFT_734121, partial [Mycena floridula]
TQYQSQVVSMPKVTVKRLEQIQQMYIWNGAKSSNISKDILASSIEKGGKKIVSIVSRNEAIDLMRLKTYLNLEPETRPKWTYVADILIRNNRNVSKEVEDTACINIFLQDWGIVTHRLPIVLQTMLNTAKKYGIEFTGFEPSL